MTAIMSTTLKRKIIFPIVSIVIGISACLVVLEIVLRFLPVCDAQLRRPVNEHNPVARFEPNRTVQWSSGWNLSMANTIHINNDGFVSSIDYDPHGGGPLLAVIGDSYVEASMVPYQLTGAGRMIEALAGRARVYSFGVSGSPLSEYLAFAEYARDTYHPDALVIAIIGNDFDESLLAYKKDPGYHYFAERPDGSLELVRIDYAPGRMKQIARHFALARYCLINLDLLRLPTRLRARSVSNNPYAAFVGNTVADADEDRVARSKRAVDAFLEELPERSGLDPSRILLVIDGMRPHLYDSATLAMAEGSYFDIMRRYLLEQAPPKGYEMVDLQPIFIERFAETGERFEYPNNAHWSAKGHEIFFEAMMQSGVVKGLDSDDSR